MALVPLGKFQTGSTRVEFKGSYDFNGLYKMIISWLKRREYKVHEKRYKDKIDNPLGNEVEIDLNADKKVTEYIKIYVDVSFHLWDYKEKEGLLNGKQTIYTDGRIIIWVTTNIEFDYQKRFRDGRKSSEIMGKIYHWIRDKEFQNIYMDDQEYEALRLEHEIKKFLKMETDTHAY